MSSTINTQFQSGLKTDQNCFYMPKEAVPARKKLMESDISNFAEKTDVLANQVLNQEAPQAYEGPVVIRSRHYYHDPILWPIYTPRQNVIIVDNGPSYSSSSYRSVNPKSQCPAPSSSSSSTFSSSDDDQKDNGAAALIGVVALVIGAIAIYSLGSEIATYSDTRQELNETQEFQEHLMTYQQGADKEDQDRLMIAHRAAALKNRICTRLKNSSVANLVLKSGLLTSCGVTLAGVVISNPAIITLGPELVTAAPAMITAGVIAGLVTAGGMLFKWGFDSSDKANVRDAQTLKGTLIALNER